MRGPESGFCSPVREVQFPSAAHAVNLAIKQITHNWLSVKQTHLNWLFMSIQLSVLAAFAGSEQIKIADVFK